MFHTAKPWLALGITLVILLGHQPGSLAGPLSPQAERKTFKVANGDLVIELVAAEPDVASPVAIAWDADGRLFVAEMADYPAAAGGGRIKLLEDRDSDGKFERVIVFADKLPFPNGVLPYNGGVLVTAAPNIWFLQDSDGDGKADVRRVILTGFGEGNQQLRVNGLHWGLDNWVYGANGRSDGDVGRPAATTPQPKGEKKVSLRRRDFRFHPATGEVEAIAGFSQFGLPRDDWGRRFPSWNTVPIRHVVLEERYLSRNPHLAETASVANILDPADAGRVFPISPPPQTFNREPIDYFNASCGPTIFRGDKLGQEYQGNAFVCESLTNLVHRRLLTPAGPTFLAKRAEANKEFLAGADPWFHPVNLATGPDGALYVVDFYRQWVEHPQFVPAGLRQSVDFRTGHAHGRIWRIRRHDATLHTQPRLRKAPAAELAAKLNHPNGWWRDTAQRLLVERQDRQAIPLLKKTCLAESPLARVHALWTLHGLQALDDDLLRTALADKHAGVREQALKLAEGRMASAAVKGAVLALAEDVDVRVRFQCALALGELPGAATPPGPPLRRGGMEGLAKIAQRDPADGWVRLAVLSSLGESAWPFLQVLVTQRPQWLSAPSPDEAAFLTQVATLIGSRKREEDLAGFLNLLHLKGNPALPGQFALLAGLAEGLDRKERNGFRKLLLQSPLALNQPLVGLKDLFQACRRIPLADKEPAAHRLLAFRALVQTRPPMAGPVLLDLLKPTQPAVLQSAAARALADVGGQELAAKVLDGWNLYTVATRREILTSLLRSPEHAAVLLQSIEQEKLAATELDAVARDALFRIPRPDLHKRARAIFPPLGKGGQGGWAGNRLDVTRKYQAALTLPSNRQRGAELFAKHCLTCHQTQGQGHRVGPDLSGVNNRPKEALVTDLFDPSKEVAPDFVNFVLVTTRGQVLTGLLAAETSTSVKLRRAEGAEDTVLRGEIQELRPTGQSLMPEGLEKTLTLQDAADLLDFLRRPVPLAK